MNETKIYMYIFNEETIKNKDLIAANDYNLCHVKILNYVILIGQYNNLNNYMICWKGEEIVDERIKDIIIEVEI